jgi:hypothetical protein
MQGRPDGAAAGPVLASRAMTSAIWACARTALDCTASVRNSAICCHGAGPGRRQRFRYRSWSVGRPLDSLIAGDAADVYATVARAWPVPWRRPVIK